jgi:cathepsin L
MLFDLSVQQVTSCAPNLADCGGSGGCAGSTAELAFDYVSSSSGLVQEYQYSYSSYDGVTGACSARGARGGAKIAGFVQLPANNYTALMNAIAFAGPVAINVAASSWSAYETGVFSGCNQEDPDVNHVVSAVGYGVKGGLKYW